MVEKSVGVWWEIGKGHEWEAPILMSFSELQVSEMHIYICKYCFIYA